LLENARYITIIQYITIYETKTTKPPNNNIYRSDVSHLIVASQSQRSLQWVPT